MTALKRDFSKVGDKEFDVVIVGGGIIGTAVARDAALRGLSVLLVEKEDYAYGTTSRSTRLIHGGLRYLRMLDFKLVRQDLKEREILLRIAPHLVHRLPFIIPLMKSEPMYRFSLPLGLYLYDFLAMGKSLPSWKYLSRKKTLESEPSLAKVPGLVGGCLYYDCQAELMERLCLENAIAASEKGACLLNHTAMTGLTVENGAVRGIVMKDSVSGAEYTARGRLVVNAGGPWADFVAGKVELREPLRFKRTKGVHLLTRKLADNALVLFARSNGRLFFVIPWGDYSLLGTTDTDFRDDLDTARATQADIDYLLTETARYFPDFKASDVYYSMAGLRPLVDAKGKEASNTSRSHQLLDHAERDGIAGFITVGGGKITAARGIAEEATDLICRKLGIDARCTTAVTPFPGAPAVTPAEKGEAAREFGVSDGTVGRLVTLYGSRFREVLGYVKKDGRLGERVSPESTDILAQVVHAVEQEQALTLTDFMLRRSDIGLGPTLGIESSGNIAAVMAPLLGWDGAGQREQVEAYLALTALRE